MNLESRPKCFWPMNKQKFLEDPNTLWQIRQTWATCCNVFHYPFYVDNQADYESSANGIRGSTLVKWAVP